MEKNRKKIVIVGGGFSGIAALKELAHLDADIVVVDKRSSQIFQPLLFQVATCNISGEDLQSPIRGFLKDHDHIQFIKDLVERVDREEKKVYLQCGKVLSYDWLFMAVGSVINHYGMKDVEENAFSMKSARDAIKIRTHILNQLDKAANEENKEEIQKHLSFVVAGGGPTGVELVGSLMELIKDDWAIYYPRLKNYRPKVYLLEGAPCVLGMLPEKQQKLAVKWLEEMGIEVHLSTQITGYDGRYVTLKDKEPIETETLIWCAGVKANPLIDSLGVEQGHAGRIVVTPTLQCKDDPSIFAAGDTAHYQPSADERPLAMTAAVATQEGYLVGKNIKAICEGRPLSTFTFNDRGFIAIIGRGRAVGSVMGSKMEGYFCWVIWAILHIFLPYSKHVRWSLFWKFLWNGVTGSSPYRNTVE